MKSGSGCSVQGAGLGSAHRRCLPPQLARDALGRLPSPPPVPENLLLGLHRKLPSAPLRAPRRFRNPKIGQQLGAQPTPRFRLMIEALIEALIDPLPPFTFCCPQAIVDQDAGVSIPNISLLPLDEVPVHVHPFAARALCDSKGSECQCGIHRAEAASALRSRKTERAAKEKPTPISQIFFSTCCALHCSMQCSTHCRPSLFAAHRR